MSIKEVIESMSLDGLEWTKIMWSVLTNLLLVLGSRYPSFSKAFYSALNYGDEQPMLSRYPSFSKPMLIHKDP